MSTKFLAIKNGVKSLEALPITDRYLVFVTSQQMMLPGLIPIVSECPFAGRLVNIKATLFTSALLDDVLFDVEMRDPISLLTGVVASINIPAGAISTNQTLLINVLPGAKFFLNMYHSIADPIRSMTVTITIQVD